MRLLPLLVLPVLASAQTTPFTGPVTLQQSSGFLMVEWSPVSGFSTRTTGETNVLYFLAPTSGINFMTQMPQNNPGMVASAAATTPFLITAVVLSQGVEVGPASTLGKNALYPAGGASGYVGFNHSGSGSTYFGWLRFTSTTTSITLEEIHMNAVAGAPVVTGQLSAVPEPSTYGLGLAGLALGIAAIRRRRALR